MLKVPFKSSNVIYVFCKSYCVDTIQVNFYSILCLKILREFLKAIQWKASIISDLFLSILKLKYIYIIYTLQT